MLGARSIFKYFSAAWCLIYVSLVVFGAPLLTDILGTIALTTVIALTSVLPLLLVVQNETHLVDIVFKFPDTSLTTPGEITRILVAIGVILTVWISSALYPLDWDRWFQRYPIPGFLGTFAGTVVGLLAGLFNQYTGKIFPNCRTTKKQW